ncbi:hypothetical protein Dimus_011290 [Dionaea muscipula]
MGGGRLMMSFFATAWQLLRRRRKKGITVEDEEAMCKSRLYSGKTSWRTIFFTIVMEDITNLRQEHSNGNEDKLRNKKKKGNPLWQRKCFTFGTR